MQTSSFGRAAAIIAALTLAPLGSAYAGGWVVSGRPGFAPPMRMGAPFRAAPRAFGGPGFFRHGAGPTGPFARFDGGPSGRFGNARFAPLGQFARRGQFARPGRTVGWPLGGAQIIPIGIAGGGYAPRASPYIAFDQERPVNAYVWAPINVSVAAPAFGCADDASPTRPGGPRIITFERPHQTGSAEKMPIIIYGTGPRPGC
jgi:hypothetical protein